MKKFLYLLFFLPALSLSTRAQLSSNPDKFLGNITTRYNVDYGSEKFYTLWNQITPENETKWDAIEGSGRGSFSFGNADKSANYAKQHNFPFKYHTLIWGAQYPSWMNNLSTAEQYKAIVEYFDGVKNHYPNLEIIDVVNEAITGHQPAPYRAALGGEGRTGYDWIIKAFQLAHERWPNAILVYNDYNTFQWQKTEFINLVRTLRDAGAPVDAYGCQSHDLTDMSLSSFKSAMNEIQNALKMPMYSTEFDIGTSDDQKQLTQYKNLLPVIWEADYCGGITLWGYIYGATWTTDGNSGLIRDGKDRPAMTWLREYMKSDKAKNAKSPFPGFKKEASVYVKPASMKVAKGDKLPVWVDATLATKTIEKVELYEGSNLVATMTEAPYITEFTSSSSGTKTLKAVVTATDSSQYERLARVNVLSSTAARKPYNDVVPELPGVVVAKNYDEGASGVSFNNASRTGVTKSGGWMEYTVDVKETGLYSVDMEVASAQNGGLFHLVDNHFGDMIFLSDFVTVPNTGSATEYKTVHLRLNIPMEEGRRTLCLCVDNGGFNIGKMTFTRLEVDNSMRVTVKTSPSTMNVGGTATITVSATSSKSNIANVRLFANDMVLDTLTEAPYVTEFVPSVKGTYTITAIATDAEGLESKIAKTTLKVNGIRTPYKEVTLPGIVQCEDFDKGGEGLTFHDSDDRDEGDAKYRTDNEGVDIVKGNGGSAIGYTANNEWLEYTINVTKGGTYNCEATVSSGTTGAAFTLSLRDNGKTTQLCKISIPQTGNSNWDTYTTVNAELSKELPEGQHILRITITGANGNLDKLTFTRTGTDPEDEVFTDLAQLKDGQPFAIASFEQGKAFYGIDDQNLGFDGYDKAFTDNVSDYYFQLESLADNSDTSIRDCYLLRLLQPDGTPYNIWGKPGYLNSQPETGTCCFILGLNDQNGEDIKNGAVWDIKFVEGKGFSLLNKGTGKYLHDASPAKYDDPAYFNFCSKAAAAAGIYAVETDKKGIGNDKVYDLQGRRMNGQLRKGLYIVNGKKIIIGR
jgi:GH35 family endo-1,4-beta-xylanase